MSPPDLRCPGQSTMFWKPDDIYDVVCPACAKPVEFWKDDARRTCACGHRFSNPKRDLGCLEYCQYAEACMPEMFQGENLQAVYRDRLVAAIRGRYRLHPSQVEGISRAVEQLEGMPANDGGGPKVAIASGIFSALLAAGVEGLNCDQARALLAKVGTEAEVIDRVCAAVWP